MDTLILAVILLMWWLTLKYKWGNKSKNDGRI